MTAVISVKEVTFSYGGPVVLEGVSLDVADGEFLGVVGPNAGGKSTLLRLMLGLLEPTIGSIEVGGRGPSEGSRMIGYVPQYPPFARDFPITVEQTVLLGRLGTARVLGGYSQRDRDIAERVMAETEILNIQGRRLNTLSGGQLQRVLLARALASEPKILMLDEPTANLDVRMESDIFELLRKLNQRVTIIVVSHDIGFISRYVGRVACVNRTLICHSTLAIDGKVIQELYGGDVHMVEHSHG
jgi:zinc transport system ATP-binding protein